MPNGGRRRAAEEEAAGAGDGAKIRRGAQLFPPGETNIRFYTWATIDWTRAAGHCLDIHQILSRNLRLKQHTRGRQVNINRFDAHFVAAGILACAQNLIRSGIKYEIEDFFDEMEKVEIVHVKPMLEVAAQYGCVVYPSINRILEPADLKSSVKRAVRLAVKITEADGRLPVAETVRRAANAAWAPTGQKDYEFDLYVKWALSEWAKEKDIDWLRVSEYTEVFTGEDEAPAWLKVISEGDRDEVKWIFEDRPQGEQAWVDHLNAIPEEFYKTAGVPRPVSRDGLNRKWDAADLNFELDVKDGAFGRIVDKWQMQSTALEYAFHVAGRDACKSHGSLTQTCEIDTYVDGHTTFKTWTSTSRKEIELALMFPPLARHVSGQEQACLLAFDKERSIESCKREYVRRAIRQDSEQSN